MREKKKKGNGNTSSATFFRKSLFTSLGSFSEGLEWRGRLLTCKISTADTFDPKNPLMLDPGSQNSAEYFLFLSVSWCIYLNANIYYPVPDLWQSKEQTTASKG